MKKLNRGRPVKKPGYDRDAEIQELINTAVGLAFEPFDDTIQRDPDLPTLKDIAEVMKTTPHRVRKLLITGEFYTTPVSRRVQQLSSKGMSIPEIMAETRLGQASVYSYLPYKKGAYNLDEPTLYSEQAKRYRNRKATVEELHDHMDTPYALLHLWKCIVAFQDYPFTTSGRGSHPGVKYKYAVSAPGGAGGHKYSGETVDGYGNELWIITADGTRNKSISRSTVDLAYKNGLKLMEADGKVKGPKALGVPGAGSYLYPILLRFGVIEKEATDQN